MGTSRWFQGVVVVVAALFSGCDSPTVPNGDAVINLDLPDVVADWEAAGEIEAYDPETIYSYIDGHAEVYLAYGMMRCLSRRYVAPDGGDEVVVDLFEMASPADAYGVFSHDRAGDPAAVGQGSVFRHGWLSFWQGSWYGSVYASAEGDEAHRAVLAIGEAVAAALPGGGEVPAIVARLPEAGLDPDSVCFLRSPQILNAHVWTGSDNPFSLDPGVEAVVAGYELGDADVHLLVVRYPSDEAAAAVAARIRAAEQQPAGGLPAMTVARVGNLLAALIGPDTGDAGDRLLEEALGGEG